MKVIVISTGSYPFGGAATNRHLSYLKGLVELDTKVKLIVLQPDKNQSVLSNKTHGVFDGIFFEYAIWYKQSPKFFILKAYYRIKAHIRTIQIINRESINSKNELKLVVLLTNPLDVLLYIFISKKNNTPIFHERTEYPFLGMNSFVKKIQLFIYLKFVITKLNGIYVISNALVEYFSKYIKGKDKILHIPMTVEPGRFRIVKGLTKYGRYIAYCGTMYSDKDGLPILIKAFDLFANWQKDVNLVLIGDINQKEKLIELQKVVNQSKNRERIFFTGHVERNDMPNLLVNAEVLALARPDNIQAKGGFPTKLGEYLATGNPIVVTKVGEIPDYLTHLKNAYMAEPDSPDDFAEKLNLVYGDLRKAKEIGLEGQKLTNSVFNYKKQAKSLMEFFNG